MSGLSPRAGGMIRSLLRGPASRPAPPAGAMQFLDELASSPEMMAAERARRRGNMFTGVRGPAQAPSVNLDTPATRRMLDRGMEGEDVMDMLRRNDRVSTLGRVNAMRKGGETAELYTVAQQGIRDAAARSRMANQMDADAMGMADNLGLAGLGVAAGTVLPYAVYQFTQSDMPEEVEPIEPEVVDFEDEASVYVEPSTPGYDPIDTIGGEEIEVYVPPEDEEIVAAMLEEAMVQPKLPDLSDVDMSLLTEAPGFSSPSNDELYELMHGGQDTYMGKPRIPGMSDRQMEQMDYMVMKGMSPERAASLVRGKAQPSMGEMRLMMQRPY